MTAKPQRRNIRILAHLYAMQKASREISGGILHYAATHPDVEVQFFGESTPRRRMDYFRAWRPDGLIIGSASERTIQDIVNLGCSAAIFVNVSAPPGAPIRHSSIYCDNGAVAEAAMKLFLGKRLENFAFVGSRMDDEWSRERAAAFQRLAKANGGTFASFAPPAGAKTSLRHELAALVKWITALPKPCGMFAANDARAKDVLDACRDAAVSVPEHMMVLGVDDEEFICRQTVPTLSSIVPDFERGGYLAAEMLVKLICGRKRVLPRRTFGVHGVIERVSTSDPNDAGRRVGRARDFINAYAAADISVEDVAKAAGASLRLLQKDFKEITGTTVREAIQSCRLGRVCAMLSDTTTPIGRIGEMCGFNDEAHLKRLFRLRFGVTMRDWRKGRRQKTALQSSIRPIDLRADLR